MTRTISAFLVAVAAAAVGAPAGTASAHPREARNTTMLAQWRGTPVQPVQPPPPPRIERVRPRRGYVWIDGRWDWRGNRYVWLDGHWERERHGHRWHGGHWDRRDNNYVWIEGNWEPWQAGAATAVPPPPPPGHGPGRYYAPRPISIQGQVLAANGRPVPNVIVVLAGGSEARVVTGPDGRYVFTGLPPGSYAVRPNSPRCSFAPDVVNLSNLGGDTVQNFNAACAGWR